MRYPMRRNGLAVPIQDLGFDSPERKRGATNNHHLYYTAEDYSHSRITQIFRALQPHVITMWIPEHADLHRLYKPPTMPRSDIMLGVIDEYIALHAALDVVRESRTWETYQINPEEWDRIQWNAMKKTPGDHAA